MLNYHRVYPRIKHEAKCWGDAVSKMEKWPQFPVGRRMSATSNIFTKNLLGSAFLNPHNKSILQMFHPQNATFLMFSCVCLRFQCENPTKSSPCFITPETPSPSTGRLVPAPPWSCCLRPGPPNRWWSRPLRRWRYPHLGRPRVRGAVVGWANGKNDGILSIISVSWDINPT